MDDWTSSDRISAGEVLRWTSSAAIVLVAHGLFAVAVLARPDQADPEAGSPVVMVDLAPVASARSKTPSDQPPAPQMQAESEARVRQDQESQEKPPEERTEEMATRNSEVTLPQETPDPPREEEKARQEAQDATHAAAPQGADVMAALPASPSAGVKEDKTSIAIATWERSLSNRLDSKKTYPSRARGAKGTAQVMFRIDRNGHVVDSRIVRSSGSAILDEDALATLKRADPFPVPPDGITDDNLAITAPIRYKLPNEH
jgi:protein TonB